MFSGHLKLPQTIPDSPLDGQYSGSQVPPVGDRRHLAAFAPLGVVGGVASRQCDCVGTEYPFDRLGAMRLPNAPVVHMGRAHSDRSFAGARLSRS